MSKKTTNITPREVEELLACALLQNGASQNEVVGFLVSEKLHGVLRPGCPAWIRNCVADQIGAGQFTATNEINAARFAILKHANKAFELGLIKDLEPET